MLQIEVRGAKSSYSSKFIRSALRRTREGRESRDVKRRRIPRASMFSVGVLESPSA